MTAILWVTVITATLMYVEGLLLAGVISAVTKPPKWVIPLLLLLWPIALPILGYRTFLKYHPIIKEVRQNPLFSAMLGLNQPANNTSPLAAILGNQTQNNPFESMIAQKEKHPVEENLNKEEDDKGE